MDTAAILELIKEIAEAVINPRFRALEQTDVETKSSANDLVTIADKEAEAHLAETLRRIYPGALVIGEEAVFVNPDLRRRLPGADHALVIDPIDGTRNFVKGRVEHGVMLAETRAGVTTRGWIWQPQTGRGYVAERGAGVLLNGEPIVPEKHDRLPLGASSRERLQGFTAEGELSPVAQSYFACAFDYPRVLHGELDFIQYTKMLPWDHLAGSLMVVESGGVSRTMNGSDYTAASDTRGLIVASSEQIWDKVRACWPVGSSGKR
jgi:inositol monophosphatase family protein